MSYPSAYCVKCRDHTDTQNRHTVVLTNKSRALTGVCPKCQNQVYKFMPKKAAQKALSMFKTSGESKQSNVLTRGHSGSKVIKALGTCPSCHSDRMAAFGRRETTPSGGHVLIGNCLTCRGVVRKSVEAKDLAALNRMKLPQDRRRDPLEATYIQKMIHRSFPWVPLCALLGGVFLGLFLFKGLPL